MIYRLLKFLCQITLRAYFGRVRIIGKEKIPSGVPCIFIANHPSAFMDPIVVASTVKQPIYFIAAGEYVGTGVKGWFFKKFLHMIPVFRPSTRPGEVHRNKEMFNHCFDHLTAGGSLLIFPEGVSVTERKIKPFKTGLARIARGAELRNRLQLHLHIVPIGLNYSNPHRFRSDLFVNVGEPIKVADLISAEEKAEVAEVEHLTDVAEKSLLDAVIHVGSDDDEALLTMLNTIYSRDLKIELGIDYHEQEKEFQVQKEMTSAIRFFKENQPEKFAAVRDAIENYARKLRYYSLTDKDIKEIKMQRSFRRITSYILGLPIFALGFLNNVIPYFSVDFIVRRIRIHETFRGSIQLAVGLFIYLGFYIGAAVLLGSVTPLGWLAVFYPLIMYVSGIYALLYLQAIRYTRQRKLLRARLRADQSLVKELVIDRKTLIAQLEECREEFEASKVPG